MAAFLRLSTTRNLHSLVASSAGNSSNLYRISRCLSTVGGSDCDQFSRFVVCGGGAGGLAVASTLAARYGKEQVAIIEPSEVRALHSSYCACSLRLL